MSFFTFNQLYGQWHVMSHADSRPKAKDVEFQSETLSKEKDSCDKEEVVEAQAQSEAQYNKVDDTALKGSDTAPVSFNSKETLESEPENQNKDISADPEVDEELSDIEYLHLPSKTLKELEDRIKNSPTARRKFRLWKETMGMCIYCGKHINALDFVSGVNSDIEHILPRALGGRSNFENLVCSCRKCNRDKGDMTAMDYVLTLTPKKQSDYLNTLRLLVSSGAMSHEKYFNLLRPVMLVKIDNTDNTK